MSPKSERQPKPENDNEFGKIIAKAWRDPAFKAELIVNPATALKAEGMKSAGWDGGYSGGKYRQAVPSGAAACAYR